MYVGVDLGGTNAKAGVVDGSGNLLKRADIPLADKVSAGLHGIRFSLSSLTHFFIMTDTRGHSKALGRLHKPGS